MKRRKFLTNALSTTAAATGLHAFGRPLFAASPAKPKKKLSVGIVGCGRMGQYYADVYKALPDTELVAIAEWNDERRPIVGKRFGVKALFKDVDAMLQSVVPDVVAIITPSKFMKGAVIACAEAGVKGISTDKPIAARLSDADAMVDACAKRNIVFAGGNLQRAKWTVQHAARKLRSGELGKPIGAAMHGFGGEISGGGCQHISVLRLFTNAEVSEVIAWGEPAEALADDKDDSGLNINGRFRMSSGLDCQVFGLTHEYGSQKNLSGVQVWTDDSMVSWNWNAPQVFRGFDAAGKRQEVDPKYPPYPWSDTIEKAGLETGDSYLVSSIRTFLNAVTTGSELWISGHDLRQALEVAIACKRSAQLGSKPVKLPLEDRSLALYPRPYRWLGGDPTGRSQSAADAAGK